MNSGKKNAMCDKKIILRSDRPRKLKTNKNFFIFMQNYGKTSGRKRETETLYRFPWIIAWFYNIQVQINSGVGNLFQISFVKNKSGILL